MKKNGLRAGNRRSLIFYILLMAVPTVQFVVFYICVNFNSFLLAFKDYETTDKYVFTLTKNFTTWFTGEYASVIKSSFKMSLVAFAFQILIIMPLGVLFAYYIFKKHPLGGFFRVMLFLPSIVSALVVLKVYKEFLECSGLSWISKGSDAETIFAVFLGNLLVSFGTSVLLYANKMATIAPEIIESAQLDGAFGFKEFIYIVFPMIYPTFSVFIITNVAGLFTNQLNNYVLFNGQGSTPTSTIGYFLFLRLESTNSRVYLLPALSAFGLMISAITIPLTFGVRKLATKFGPSED